MRKVDEVARKPARYDPRREESEPPPPSEEVARPSAPEHPTLPPSEEAINLRELALPSEPPSPPDAAAPAVIVAAERPADEPALPSSSRDPDRARAATSHAAQGAHAFTNVDPRLEAIEPALSAGDWAAIVKLLGTDEEAGRLPPNLGLLYALARKEAEHDDAAAKHGSELTQLAIRCMAGLFGVPAQSPIALVLAKRLLRKNPVSWQQRPAPPAKVSVLFIVLAIAVGSAVGWAISQGYVRFHWH